MSSIARGWGRNASFTPKLLIDVAVTAEALTRLGVGQRWREIASELRVSPRTLHRNLHRIGHEVRAEIRDFRGLVAAIDARCRAAASAGGAP